MRLKWLYEEHKFKLFQSTHPLRDATKKLLKYMPLKTISIHAPLTGCDEGCFSTPCPTRYFNPRTPYGMRLKYKLLIYVLITISIHAPLTGCDIGGSDVGAVLGLFQSTHPLRDATLVKMWLVF